MDLTNSANDLVFNLVKQLATQGLGFSLAALFAYLWWQKDQQLQKLSQRVLRSAMQSTKDAMRQEHALANLKEAADKKARAPAEEDEP